MRFATEDAALLELMFAGKHREGADELADAAERAFAVMLELIEQGQREGALESGDPKRVGLVLFATIQGIAASVSAGLVEPGEVGELFADATERFLRGARGRPPIALAAVARAARVAPRRERGRVRARRASSAPRTRAGPTSARSPSCAPGASSSHWMWFVFPQIAGLGSSAMAQEYAIGSLAEARAYLADPVLGARLRECARALLALRGELRRGGARAPSTPSSCARR